MGGLLGGQKVYGSPLKLLGGGGGGGLGPPSPRPLFLRLWRSTLMRVVLNRYTMVCLSVREIIHSLNNPLTKDRGSSLIQADKPLTYLTTLPPTTKDTWKWPQCRSCMLKQWKQKLGLLNNYRNYNKIWTVWFYNIKMRAKRCRWIGKQFRPWSDYFWSSWDLAVPIFRV